MAMILHTQISRPFIKYKEIKRVADKKLKLKCIYNEKGEFNSFLNFMFTNKK